MGSEYIDQKSSLIPLEPLGKIKPLSMTLRPQTITFLKSFVASKNVPSYKALMGIVRIEPTNEILEKIGKKEVEIKKINGKISNNMSGELSRDKNNGK